MKLKENGFKKKKKKEEMICMKQVKQRKTGFQAVKRLMKMVWSYLGREQSPWCIDLTVFFSVPDLLGHVCCVQCACIMMWIDFLFIAHSLHDDHPAPSFPPLLCCWVLWNHRCCTNCARVAFHLQLFKICFLPSPAFRLRQVLIRQYVLTLAYIIWKKKMHLLCITDTWPSSLGTCQGRPWFRRRNKGDFIHEMRCCCPWDPNFFVYSVCDYVRWYSVSEIYTEESQSSMVFQNILSVNACFTVGLHHVWPH